MVPMGKNLAKKNMEIIDEMKITAYVGA